MQRSVWWLPEGRDGGGRGKLEAQPQGDRWKLKVWL